MWPFSTDESEECDHDWSEQDDTLLRHISVTDEGNLTATVHEVEREYCPHCGEIQNCATTHKRYEYAPDDVEVIGGSRSMDHYTEDS